MAKISEAASETLHLALSELMLKELQLDVKLRRKAMKMARKRSQTISGEVQKSWKPYSQ